MARIELLYTAPVTLIYADGETKTYTVTGEGEDWRHLGVFLDDAKARKTLKDWSAPMSQEVAEMRECDHTPAEVESVVKLHESIMDMFPIAKHYCTEAEFECHWCGRTFTAYFGDFEFSKPYCGCPEEGSQNQWW